MKKLLFIVPVIFIFLLLSARKSPTLISIISQTPTPTVFKEKSNDSYTIIKTKPDRVTLIPNFSDKKISNELMQENNCTSGVNGGFYDTANQPLGLFISNFQTVHAPVESALLNGYIVIDANNGVFIGRDLPDMQNRIALQTGPLLIINGQPLTLAIKNDEPARRMIAAVNTDGSIIFIVLYKTDAVFDGPMLGDVPSALTAINTKEMLNITDAINLDGGSASAFYSDRRKFSELTPVGSFFCIKELQ